MKIAVTDADSALGSMVLACAKRRGHDVVRVCRAISVDLDGYALARALEGVDALIHLNQAMGEATDATHRQHALRATRLVVDMALHESIAAFVHLSSYAAYGVTDRWPIDVTQPLAPRDALGLGHHEAEAALSVLAGEHIPVAVLRAAQRLNEPVSEPLRVVLKLMADNRTLWLPTSLNNRRQFASDHALSDALVAAAERCEVGQSRQTFHVGAAVGRCLADDLDAVAAEMGRDAWIVRPPSPALAGLWASRYLTENGDVFESAMDTFRLDMVLNTAQTEAALGICFEGDNAEVLGAAVAKSLT